MDGNDFHWKDYLGKMVEIAAHDGKPLRGKLIFYMEAWSWNTTCREGLSLTRRWDISFCDAADVTTWTEPKTLAEG